MHGHPLLADRQILCFVVVPHEPHVSEQADEGAHGPQMPHWVHPVAPVVVDGLVGVVGVDTGWSKITRPPNLSAFFISKRKSRDVKRSRWPDYFGPSCNVVEVATRQAGRVLGEGHGDVATFGQPVSQKSWLDKARVVSRFPSRYQFPSLPHTSPTVNGPAPTAYGTSS